MPLEYPITRPYTLPHLTAYVSGVSLVAIVGLIILNFAVQGYEVITVLRSDPNVTDSHWWKPRTIPGWELASRCDPVSLSGYSSFRTNSSMFSYDIRGIFDSNGNSIAGATSYMANSLSQCEVEGVLVITEPLQDGLKFNTMIRCIGSNIPFSLSLFSSFAFSANPYHDDFNIFYSRNRPAWDVLESAEKSNAVPLNASALTNVIGVIDALSSDFIRALVLQMDEIAKNNGSLPTKISSGVFFVCPGGRNATCEHEDKKMIIPVSQTYYRNRTTDVSIGPGPFYSPFQQSMTNVLVAVKDAYHIDLGNVRPSNALLSKTAFDRIMKPDEYLVKGIQSAPPGMDMVCSNGLGCLVGSTFVQRLLSSEPGINVVIPTTLPTGNAPAMIKLDYLCPSYKLKSIGSLLASVFIGTWSMYMALFGVFRFVGPILERRYGRGNTEDGKGDFSLDPASQPSYPDLQECKASNNALQILLLTEQLKAVI